MIHGTAGAAVYTGIIQKGRNIKQQAGAKAPCRPCKGRKVVNMKKFIVGRTYSASSPCDHNCVWSFTVIRRTAKTITVTDGKETKTLRILAGMTEYRQSETVLPLGRYSMCPVLSAD